MTPEKLILERLRTSDDGTFGVLRRGDIEIAVTAELPWNDNIVGASCIPKGVYLCTLAKSPSKNKQVDYMVYRINDVTDRTNVLIHIANWPHELKGCVGVGEKFAELNGKPAVTNSTNTMKRLLADLPRSFYLQVMGVCG